MEKDRTFAQLVKEARQARSMSQAALASAAGIDERTVMRAERGSSLSPETVMALCSVLAIAPTAAKAALSREASEPVVVMPAGFGPGTDALRAIAVETALRTIDGIRLVTAGDLAEVAATTLTPTVVGRQSHAQYGAFRREGQIEAFVRDQLPPAKGSPEEKKNLVFNLYITAAAVMVAGAMGLMAAAGHLPDMYAWLAAAPIEIRFAVILGSMGLLAWTIFALHDRELKQKDREEEMQDAVEATWRQADLVLVTLAGSMRLVEGAGNRRTQQTVDARMLTSMTAVANPGTGTVTWTAGLVDGTTITFPGLPDDPRVTAELDRLAAIGAGFGTKKAA